MLEGEGPSRRPVFCVRYSAVVRSGFCRGIRGGIGKQMAQVQERGLQLEGMMNLARVHWNLSVPALYEETVRRREGLMADDGALVCRTGQHTGRSPNDKFIVKEPSSADRVWWGKVNRPIVPEHFDALHKQLLAYARHHRDGVAQPVRQAHVHWRGARARGGPRAGVYRHRRAELHGGSGAVW